MALIERRGRVVTKNELLDIVWPGLVVEENNLQVQISALRRILGMATFATIPGVGYRFSARIECDEEGASARTETPPERRLTNIPAAKESLIGRESDTDALRKAVRGHRLVTIVGSAGIGKTRVAQEVARVDRLVRRMQEEVPVIPLHRQVIPWASRSNVSVVHRPNNWLVPTWVKVH